MLVAGGSAKEHWDHSDVKAKEEGASRQMTHPRIVYRELVFRDRGYRIPSYTAARIPCPR